MRPFTVTCNRVCVTRRIHVIRGNGRSGRPTAIIHSWVAYGARRSGVCSYSGHPWAVVVGHRGVLYGVRGHDVFSVTCRPLTDRPSCVGHVPRGHTIGCPVNGGWVGRVGWVFTSLRVRAYGYAFTSVISRLGHVHCDIPDLTVGKVSQCALGRHCDSRHVYCHSIATALRHQPPDCIATLFRVI